MKAQIWQKGAFVNPVSYCCIFLSRARKWRGADRPESRPVVAQVTSLWIGSLCVKGWS